ncbi:hypothetical protein SmJEL517_g02616 [Synchytrium microbalum]|uniref:Uncharacterized protein n=1 Tax=Synchytrium microbalum TaxID=1806994 RepID=A0A507CA37_9FUNG|nr:uncharacterized protein SmJEL517_g02616 [Synchytrium microbalum]TPX34844.1 hypothetical protein SmJEL517_g02616 [Synchytrium microbalum]
MNRLARHTLFNRQAYTLRPFINPRFTRPNTQQASSSAQQARGWRKYVDAFRDKPASHVIAFAILHEVTALLPLPLVYYTLSYTDIHIPIPDYLIVEANKRASYLLKMFGMGAVKDDSKALLDMATSYALVKAAMPLRLGASFLLTPWFARTLIAPITKRLGIKV